MNNIHTHTFIHTPGANPPTGMSTEGIGGNQSTKSKPTQTHAELHADISSHAEKLDVNSRF